MDKSSPGSDSNGDQFKPEDSSTDSDDEIEQPESDTSDGEPPLPSLPTTRTGARTRSKTGSLPPNIRQGTRTSGRLVGKTPCYIQVDSESQEDEPAYPATSTPKLGTSMCAITLECLMDVKEADLLKQESTTSLREEVRGITAAPIDLCDKLPDLDYVTITDTTTSNVETDPDNPEPTPQAPQSNLNTRTPTVMLTNISSPLIPNFRVTLRDSYHQSGSEESSRLANIRRKNCWLKMEEKKKEREVIRQWQEGQRLANISAEDEDEPEEIPDYSNLPD